MPTLRIAAYNGKQLGKEARAAGNGSCHSLTRNNESRKAQWSAFKPRVPLFKRLKVRFKFFKLQQLENSRKAPPDSRDSSAIQAAFKATNVMGGE